MAVAVVVAVFAAGLVAVALSAAAAVAGLLLTTTSPAVGAAAAAATAAACCHCPLPGTNYNDLFLLAEVVHNAAISCCERGQQWEQALVVLARLGLRKEADVVSAQSCNQSS